MDKLGPALRRVAKFLGGQRVDASAASVSRLEYGHSLACACELAGRHQPRSPGADHHEMGWMLRRHRSPIRPVSRLSPLNGPALDRWPLACEESTLTPDASGNLGAFGGHSLLNSGTRQHAGAVLHDARHFGGVDAITFDPGADGEKVRITNRVPIAHDPRTLQELVFDQLEAFRHVRRRLSLHCLDGVGAIRPPCAPHAMGVRNMHGRAKITIELLNLCKGERIRERGELGLRETL